MTPWPAAPAGVRFRPLATDPLFPTVPRKGFGDKLPAHWPEFGTHKGRQIRLADVEATLPPVEWDNVAVEVEPGTTIRPWRGLPDGSAFG